MTKNRLEDCYRPGCFCSGALGDGIGDDLSPQDLDDLWAVLTGRPEVLSTEDIMSGWWADKPHQLAYRLLLRLTRAEDALRKTGLLPTKEASP